MPTKPPAFQLYAKDWLSSPAVRTMSLAAQGAYIRLLATSWDSDPIATLPNDDRKLRILAGATPQEWKAIRASILENFEKNKAGLLFNKRLMEQWKQLKAFRSKQIANGKKGGRPKGLGYSWLTQTETKKSSASASSSSSATSKSKDSAAQTAARRLYPRERKALEVRREITIGKGPDAFGELTPEQREAGWRRAFGEKVAK